MSEGNEYREKDSKRYGTRYCFEHSSGSIRIDILANNKNEAREVLVKTVKRPDLYSFIGIN